MKPTEKQIGGRVMNKANEKEHGIKGTIQVRTAILLSACINTNCEWHTCHWSGLYENGCYMLKDNSKCITGEKSGFTRIRQEGE